jgi:hypothetical protein
MAIGFQAAYFGLPNYVRLPVSFPSCHQAATEPHGVASSRLLSVL